MIKAIPLGGHRILDIGCGEGSTGHYLKEHGRASCVVGIEMNKDAAKKAVKCLDHVIEGDLEGLSLDGRVLEPCTFDFILCGDVIEHLKDPWKQLHRLQEYLKADGKIILSVPNVRHWKVTVPLVLAGEWNYTDSGLLDKTHLRFFTKKSIIRLLADTGYRIESCEPNIGHIRYRLFDNMTFGLFQGFLAVQWTIVARSAQPPRKNGDTC
jgi:2-polyprenyl-3-methyl-5-hydroxy-6-metoxy-1,4-benzoquinol methylase